MTVSDHLHFASLFRDLGIKRSAMSIITGRCGSTLVGEVCRTLRFGDGAETLNALAMGQIAPNDTQRITQILRPAIVDGIFYHQTTYHRWKKLSEFIAPMQLGFDVTLIFRRNVIAQAISYVNAVESGKWHSNQPAVTPIPMNPEERIKRGIGFIKQILAEEERLQAAWPTSPVFFYEEIVTSPLESMQRFFTFYRHEVSLSQISAALNSDENPRKLMRKGYHEQYEQLFNSYPGAAEMLWSRFNGDSITQAHPASSGPQAAHPPSL